MSTVYLVSEVRSPLVDFGLAEIRKALNAAGLEAVGPWPELRDDPAPRPMIDCRKYLVRERMPFGSRLTILIQSSHQPIAPQVIITASTSQT